ncbi:SixA phosphatase family protein [Nitratifractor sp.]
MHKRIYIMRHAKSSWKKPLPDRERPLNRRGKRAARLVGHALARRGIRFDLVLSSPARRARSTAKRVLKALGEDPGLLIEQPWLYGHAANEMLEALLRLDPRCNDVLIVGHNPEISELVVLLSGDRRYDWLPTGALVALEFPIEEWEELKGGAGKVLFTLYPRSLERES